MGVSTDAILAYGYDIGGRDEEFKVREVDAYGDIVVNWFTDPEDDDEVDGIIDQAATHLTEHGVIGVELVEYCSMESPMYLVAAHRIRVRRGHVESLSLSELAQLPASSGYDDLLATALAVLGLTPIQPEPRWLLVSNWS